MAQYNEGYNERQKDLVLATNEFVFVQSKTNGQIKTYTGPIMLTISAQESLVYFDTYDKQFKETTDFNKAKQLFVSAPEGWYATLKNPAIDNAHPEAGKATISPDLEIGKKINISGPCSFSLYPGQMAKVKRGHALRSNEYLLARVYEAESASQTKGEMLDAEGKRIEVQMSYVNGQILVIKGTEVSFYIPPTGIEVIAVNNNDAEGYVRDAVTLERLEYCILKDENGTKRYVHGPEVVFPEPTETFVSSAKGGVIFKAIELSKISGIYVKVIAEYTETDKDGAEVVHPVGEELFITGDDQMIYYPRPEHTIISYDNKFMHHAIAIPEGEGRYIMNRLTSEIKTVRGPAMYLPDPRTEVVVKRKLTPSQCALWYPGNEEVAIYNRQLSEKSVEKSTKNRPVETFGFMGDVGTTAPSTSYTYTTDTSYAPIRGVTSSNNIAELESNASVARGTSYTKPRTITLDNKLDGVVSLDIWTGYAVNVISKNGDRKVVCGPQTILLDYDQTLEVLQMSTGTPKTTDSLIKTVYLRHMNNKISDIINIETKDFVKAEVKVSYCLDFDPEYIDKWFDIENYVKYMCDRQRTLIKRAAKEYTIEDFYQNYADIVRNIAIDTKTDESDSSGHVGRFFPENGMYVHDCEVLSLHVEAEVGKLMKEHQFNMVRKALDLSDAERRIKVASALADAEKKEQDLRTEQLLHKMELQEIEASKKVELQSKVNRKNEAEKMAAKQAEKDMQGVIDEIQKAQLAREAERHEQEQKIAKDKADLEAAQQAAYAETVAKIMGSIAPGLIEAMNGESDKAMVSNIAKSLAPYAMSKGESVADFTTQLLKGTGLEKYIKDVNLNI